MKTNAARITAAAELFSYIYARVPVEARVYQPILWPMPGERETGLERYTAWKAPDDSTGKQQLQRESEYVEISSQEKAIEDSRLQVLDLYKSAQQLPSETRDLIERLCLAQQTILEEQLHAMNPEQHPQETLRGDVYKHRNEALMHIERVTRQIKDRDIRTIDANQEQ